jgi:hypothetical protein
LRGLPSPPKPDTADIETAHTEQEFVIKETAEILDGGVNEEMEPVQVTLADPNIQYGYSPGVIQSIDNLKITDLFSKDTEAQDVIEAESPAVVEDSADAALQKYKPKKGKDKKDADTEPLKFTCFVQMSNDDIEKRVQESLNPTPWKKIVNKPLTIFSGPGIDVLKL